MPTWKLKPTQLPQKQWYEENLSIKRSQNGKTLDEDELVKRERRDEQMKQMEDPLNVDTLDVVAHIDNCQASRKEY